MPPSPVHKTNYAAEALSLLTSRYQNPRPGVNVLAISPSSGTSAGGVPVMITGINFTGASSVKIGGVACTSVAVVTDTTITAVTPATSVGVLDVTVTSPKGTGTLVAGYTALNAFDPSHLSNLTGWYRADLGITMGTGVSAWADQSGSGHNLSQAIGADQPTFNASSVAFNNQPVLHCSAQWLVSASGWTLGLSTTIMVVGQDDGIHAPYSGVADNGIWWLSSHSGKYTGAGAAFFDTTISISANTPRVFILTIDGANNGTWYVSAHTANATGSPGVTNNTSGLVLGAQSSAGSGVLIGDIAEAAVFGRALTSGEAAQLLDYAGTRYGIAIGP